METLTNPNIVGRLIEQDGVWQGDPPARRIYEYRMKRKAKALFGIVYDNEVFSINTAFTRSLLWDQGSGLTIEGKTFMTYYRAIKVDRRKVE